MSRSAHRLLSAALVPLVALGLAASLLSAPAAAAVTSTTVANPILTAAPFAARSGPGFAKPANRLCYDLTQKQNQRKSHTRAAVPCTDRHTSKTFKVFRLPRGVSYSNRDRYFEVVDRRCMPAFKKVLDGTDARRTKTAFTYTVFQPTPAQRRKGARWVRCDIILNGKNELHDLPQKLTLPRKISRALTRCLSQRSYVFYSCQDNHSFRAVGVIRYFSKRYPSREDLSAAARKCEPRFFKRGDRYLFTFPDVSEWEQGSRSLLCYKKTRR